ncbi:B3 domain-containing transcription factor VRN1-like [Beta vulgaris subsp. vulgaris]|uniref:B3 domain-containing transcription factor VRN1-like n=1 Tax=Beta vulgaris subsp. vulgaris TaxID=3555 RepID=UPI0020367802|nr:B3 domain-containing transcription factor VRN1-like [Beta vulgaris subsp. vulgaris]
MRGQTSNSTLSSPTKRKGPSFFKLMVALNSTQYHMLKIPDKYVKSYYKEQLAKDYVKLRVKNIDDGRNWKIELLKESGRIWLSKGWEEFVKTYSLKYGYFLLFKYNESDSEFHVRIFDTTCCEVEYDDFAFDHNHTNKREEVKELSSQDEYMSDDDDVISSGISYVFQFLYTTSTFLLFIVLHYFGTMIYLVNLCKV